MCEGKIKGHGQPTTNLVGAVSNVHLVVMLWSPSLSLGDRIQYLLALIPQLGRWSNGPRNKSSRSDFVGEY
jgi:hypothetical protein